MPELRLAEPPIGLLGLILFPLVPGVLLSPIERRGAFDAPAVAGRLAIFVDMTHFAIMMGVCADGAGCWARLRRVRGCGFAI